MTAAELVSAGAAVVIADLPGSPGADVAGGLGDRAVFHPTDVTDPAQVQSAVDAARELGTLRIAVNCAGLGPAAKVLSRRGPMPLEDFAKVVTVNLIGTFNLVRLAAARIAALAGLPNEARASLGQQVPHPARLGKPSEYAALIRHIIENPMLNGEVIRLDGAIRMAPR